MQALTPGDISDVIEQLLAKNPALIEQENLAAIGKMLDSPTHALPATLAGADLGEVLGRIS